MNRELTSWYSPTVNKEMPIATYGHYGFALLLIPTAAADYLEYERFQLIGSISHFINSGKVKVFSVNSMNNESWMNNEMVPEHKAIRHNQFNQYVFDEVIPFIKSSTSAETPIITCGASFGALHSMNLFLKRPDLINGVIAMSGVYDLHEYTKGCSRAGVIIAREKTGPSGFAEKPPVPRRWPGNYGILARFRWMSSFFEFGHRPLRASTLNFHST